MKERVIAGIKALNIDNIKNFITFGIVVAAIVTAYYQAQAAMTEKINTMKVHNLETFASQTDIVVIKQKIGDIQKDLTTVKTGNARIEGYLKRMSEDRNN